MAAIIDEDKENFYADSGTVIPKSGLSNETRMRFGQKLASYQASQPMAGGIPGMAGMGVPVMPSVPPAAPTPDATPVAAPTSVSPSVGTGDEISQAQYVPAATAGTPTAGQPAMPSSLQTVVEGPSTSVTTKSMPKEVKADLAKADAALKSALADKTNAEVNAIAVQTETDKAVAENQIAMGQKEMELRQRQVDELKQRKADVDSAVTKLSTMKVDPGQWWKNAGTGSKIGMAIALAMGAVGQAMQRSQNNIVLDVIDKAIDTDLMAQRAAIDTQKSVVQEKTGAFQLARQLAGDEASAFLIAKEASIQRVKSQFIEKIAAARTDAEKAAGAQAVAYLDQQSAKLRADLMTISNTSNSGGVRAVVNVEGKKPGTGEIPPGMTGDQYNAAIEYQNKENELKKILGGGKDISFWGKLAPTILGGDKSKLDALNANIGGIVAEMAKLRSDVDFKEIVSKYQIKPTDTKQDVANRMNAFQQFLKAYRPGALLRLDQYRQNAGNRPYTPTSFAGN